MSNIGEFPDLSRRPPHMQLVDPTKPENWPKVKPSGRALKEDGDLVALTSPERDRESDPKASMRGQEAMLVSAPRSDPSLYEINAEILERAAEAVEEATKMLRRTATILRRAAPNA